MSQPGVVKSTGNPPRYRRDERDEALLICDLGDRARASRDPASFARLHERTWSQCQAFLDRAVGDRSTDVLDRSVRAIVRRLYDLGL